MAITKEQFDKLPKWLQQEVHVLRQRVVSAENKLAEMFGEKETDKHMLILTEEKPLPKNGTIRFTLPNKHRIECIISGNELQVYADTTLHVLPRAANSVYLTVEDCYGTDPGPNVVEKPQHQRDESSGEEA